ncbi:MAG: serine/threonine-protein kinase, partial [Chthoniobacteraceae bacterium]
MSELAHCVIETLLEGDEFLASRVTGGDGLPPRLLVMSAAESTPMSLARLEHAYSLREELNPSWATHPLELVRHEGKPALLLHDPGGEFLESLLGERWPVSQGLEIAIGMVAALGRCHAQGLIHRDIQPGSFLVNPATGAAWLTSFGLTSRLPRHRQSPEPPEVIAGTLAYIAPEQTGRMNRCVDLRSDLYSLGVTLYEMFTGELPFTASDPMEWVHCHIAKPPLPPSERAAGIPEPVCEIIMKLLAKAPEERYQTAAGAEADFRLCLSALETDG